MILVTIPIWYFDHLSWVLNDSSLIEKPLELYFPLIPSIYFWYSIELMLKNKMTSMKGTYYTTFFEPRFWKKRYLHRSTVQPWNIQWKSKQTLWYLHTSTTLLNSTILEVKMNFIFNFIKDFVRSLSFETQKWNS